jgi:hypothetical protein
VVCSVLLLLHARAEPAPAPACPGPRPPSQIVLSLARAMMAGTIPVIGRTRARSRLAARNTR